MEPKKELQLAYGLIIILLLVGILSYTASSAKAPEEPVRLMFQCSTGKVLFGHETHAADYDIACNTCHHHPEDNEDNKGCSACHVLPADGSAPQLCLDCHDADDFEIEEMVKQTDAIHSQCIGCHKEKDVEVNGRGAEECSACHLKYSF